MENYSLASDELFTAIKNEMKEKTVVVQVAPAVRVSIGEEFGCFPGEDLTAKTVGLLKQMGFHYVIDTPLGADITAYEEAHALVRMLKGEEKEHFPIFNSCCIGWRLYCKKNCKKIYNYVSEVLSPNLIVGSVAKNYLSRKLGKKPGDICVVSVMPCTLKKTESRERMPDGNLYVDYVLTTRELGEWARKEGLDIKDAPEEKFSEILENSSKDGVIFGATGGLTEAVLTTVAAILGEKKEILDFRTSEEYNSQKVKIGNHILSVASVYGIPNITKVLDEIKQGKKYHFVEVMFCQMGCVGGPGQPVPPSREKFIKRAEALRKAADKKTEKTPPDNPVLKRIYSELDIAPGGKKARGLFYFQNVRT